MPDIEFQVAESRVWWVSEGCCIHGHWGSCTAMTLHRAYPCTGGCKLCWAGLEAAWEVQRAAWKGLSMSFALRSPGDKAGASAQHMWGQLCRVRAALCGADVMLCHGNAARGQGEEGSSFVLAHIDYKQQKGNGISVVSGWSGDDNIGCPVYSPAFLNMQFRRCFLLALTWNSMGRNPPISLHFKTIPLKLKRINIFDFYNPNLQISQGHLSLALLLFYSELCKFFLYLTSPQMHTHEMDGFCPFRRRASFHQAN